MENVLVVEGLVDKEGFLFLINAEKMERIRKDCAIDIRTISLRDPKKVTFQMKMLVDGKQFPVDERPRGTSSTSKLIQLLKACCS